MMIGGSLDVHPRSHVCCFVCARTCGCGCVLIPVMVIEMPPLNEIEKDDIGEVVGAGQNSGFALGHC